MSLSDVITQKEVDAVASLVEAAGELDVEPFFGVDEPFTTTSGSSEYRIVYQLGDRFHFSVCPNLFSADLDDHRAIALAEHFSDTIAGRNTWPNPNPCIVASADNREFHP